MKKYPIVFSFVLLLCSFTPLSTYDPNHIEISGVNDKGVTYNVVYMNRGGSGNRIKAKYFAAKGNDGTTVPYRYANWSVGKDMIVVSSAGYMDEFGIPVGLTIDNGKVVNKTLASFDGLIIVYATGGIVATNLKNGDLTLQGGGIAAGRKFDIRNNYTDRMDFINWAQLQEATVFQTHLLVYKDQLTIGTNADTKSRERRFLAVGKDKASGDLCHVIVNLPEYTTLYSGTVRAKKFLNDIRDIEITFMINLDTGYQDVCFLYNRDGTINNLIHGEKPITNAVNLLGYYYQ